MSNWKLLNDYRCTIESSVVPKRYCSTSEDGFNGMFRIPMDGHIVRCVASDGEGWQHVSVSLEYEHKCPTWVLMCKIKDLFWNEDEAVIQIHPPRKDHINYHEYCLHMWRCTDGREQPLPLSIFVGPQK